MPSKRKPAADILMIAFASLVIAFFIWYIAKRADVENRDLTVPIHTDNVHSCIDVQVNPERVTVEFQYPGMYERFVESRKFEVLLDLSDIVSEAGVDEEHVTSRTLNESMVLREQGVPLAIIPMQINTTEVRVTARWRTEKAVVVTVLDGEPAENFELVGQEVIVAPSEVTLTGPLNAFERAPRDEQGRIIVHTSRIDLTGVTQGLNDQTELDPPNGLQVFIADNEPHIAIGEERYATFSYEIAEKTGERTFTEVPVGVVSLSETVTPVIDPAHVDVMVTAPVTLLEQIKLEHIIVQAGAPLGADVTDFNLTVGIKAIWAPDTPQAIKDHATLSEPEPATVNVEFSPLIEK